MKQLTNDEKNLLLEMLTTFDEVYEKESSDISKLIDYGHHAGAISGSGKLYTDNINVYEIKDKAREYIKDRKATARKLILSIIHS